MSVIMANYKGFLSTNQRTAIIAIHRYERKERLSCRQAEGNASAIKIKKMELEIHEFYKKNETVLYF